MREIEFPPEWVTGAVISHQAYACEGQIVLFGVLLDDGANLWALAYPGGHRFMRADAGSLDVLTREIGAPEDEIREAVENCWIELRRADRLAAIRADAETRRN